MAASLFYLKVEGLAAVATHEMFSDTSRAGAVLGPISTDLAGGVGNPNTAYFWGDVDVLGAAMQKQALATCARLFGTSPDFVVVPLT